MTKREAGFTFIELLVAISIMAVMMAVAIVSYSNTNVKARDAKRKTDLESIRAALEICRANYGEYPSSIITNIVCTSGGLPTTTIALNATPVDPTNPKVNHTTYAYNRLTSTTYTLSANLELPADPTAYTLSNP